MSQHIYTTFAQHDVILDAGCALILPKLGLLIVSDLHFEKGSFLATSNDLLPQYDTLDTIIRLREMITRYQPHTVVCLGDSFHDAYAHHRISDSLCEQINNLCDSVAQWIWVLGNHDPDIADCFKGKRMAHCETGQMLLTHEPMEATMPQIIGHFHPKTRIKMVRSRISGKCFVQNEHYLLMPSFGSYTGGLDTSHQAIHSYIPKPEQQKFFIYNQRIWKI